MGWGSRLVLLFGGLASFGLGLWFVGGICFALLVVIMRPRGRGRLTGGDRVRPSFPTRRFASATLGLLSLVALAAGGILSPLVLLSVAAIVLLWPHLPFGLLMSRFVPVSDSILLRSSIIPFFWHSLSEVKPGAEEFPGALSSYTGRLAVLKSGATYAHVTAFALDSRRAETVVISKFREASSSVYPKGAYLLPLDSSQSFELLRVKLNRVNPVFARLGDQGTDFLVLESEGGFVRKWGAYVISGRGSPHAAFPPAGAMPPKEPLLWEVLETLGKRGGWPEPDSYSGLLDSIRSTSGEPLAGRVSLIESSGLNVTVHALGGESVQLSRPQLRAIVSMYP